VPKDKPEKTTKEKDLIPLKAEDVMITKVAIIDENVSVKKAAEIMGQIDMGAIIVTAEGKTKGILTERDILKRIVAEGKDANKIKVKNIMSSPLITINPKTTLKEAAHIMFEKKIKNLPVSLENRLIGLVNLHDICKSQPQVLRQLRQVIEPPKNLKKVLRNYII